MRGIFVGLLAAAAIAIVTLVVPASAQVTGDTPVGPHRDHYEYDSSQYRGYADYDNPSLRGYARYGGCRTVAITRDDGSIKKIKRCGRVD
jgi:hypothetical protein